MNTKVQIWRKDPAKFIRDNFLTQPDESLDEWQLDVCQELSGGYKPRRRIAMKACTGPGKSAMLAWLGWWRLVCFVAPNGGHPKGAALSITADNLKDNLWAELAKWQARSGFLKEAFTWTKERIYANDFPETWFLAFRSFAKDADAEAIGRSLSGLHSVYPFVLLDETGDMPVAVGRAAEQIFTGEPKDAAVIQAGNPTSVEGLLYHTCTYARDQWAVTTITADPDDPKRTKRVDIELAREQINKYGPDNPWVMATILGKFPPGGFNALLTVDDIEKAMKAHYREPDYNYSEKRLGVDVARFGDDRTVIWPRQGLVAFKPIEMRNADSLQVAARVALAKRNWDADVLFIDGTGGYGAGVVDALRQGNLNAVEVQAAGKAADPQFFNVRAECWWRMTDWIKGGGALPNMPAIVREFTSPTFTYQNGKIRLEEKDQIKKRLGFSPDYADALAQTFFLPDRPRHVDAIMMGRLMGGPEQHRAVTERES